MARHTNDPREVLVSDRKLLGCPKCKEKDWETRQTPYSTIFHCRKCNEEWAAMAPPKDDPTSPRSNPLSIPGINPYQALDDWDQADIDTTPDFRKYGRDYYGDNE